MKFGNMYETYLSCSCATSLIQALAQFVELACEFHSLLLGLGSSCTLSLEFLFELLDSGGQLLDLALETGIDALLILNAGVEVVNFIVLPIKYKVFQVLSIYINVCRLRMIKQKNIPIIIKYLLLSCLLKLSLDALKILNSSLSGFQVLLKLALNFLHISANLLFTLKVVFHLE